MATTIPNRTPLIVSPHLYLGDVTGRPLDYGMVFFGEPNKDPEFYPIKVFSDKELKNELAQPVRTKGGFLNQFGDIVEVFAYEGVYSVKVLDQYGRKIFYKAEVAKQTIEDATSDVVDAAQVEINRRMFLLDGAIATAAAAAAGKNGWTANLVLDPNQEKLQSEINAAITERKVKSLFATNLADAVSKFTKINNDTPETITTAIVLKQNQDISSLNHTLIQTSQSTSNLIATDVDNVVINGLSLVQDKTSALSGGTNNNHQMTKFLGGKFNRVLNNKYDGQYAISFGYGSSSLQDRTGKFGLAAFNDATDLQGMFIETIGSQYNRLIGNALDSATLGVMHGIRLSGYDKDGNPNESTHAPNWGQVGAGNVFRRITNGVSAQNSSKFSNLTAMHFTDVDSCIHATLGTVPANDPSLHRFDFTANNTRKIANLQYLNHTKLGFAVDGSALTSAGIEELSGRTGTGFNHYEGIVSNAAKTALLSRYSHNLYNLQIDNVTGGDGAVLNGNYGGGSIIVNAANTGVSVTGNYNNLQVVATACVYTALAVSGNSNIINLQTDGNVTISGSNNTIIGRIGGNLTVSGSNNKFVGEVVGTVTRGSGTGNNYAQLKGWSDTIVVTGQTTSTNGRITVTVDKHGSAQIRNIYATIPINTSGYTSKVLSISGSTVIFEFRDANNALLVSTQIDFNYTYHAA